MATWAVVKAQARDVLGVALDNMDVLDLPLVAADEYGNFIPDPVTGFDPHCADDFRHGGLPVVRGAWVEGARAAADANGRSASPTVRSGYDEARAVVGQTPCDLTMTRFLVEQYEYLTRDLPTAGQEGRHR